eukprot:CAMPEP_0114343222 /NCGR_PEP_ID=MMETSP0101-20121206/10424_1 /TAXON_ID=38822 ORGANISM="Pteridomonas danica, Strain PT" /NCGR_SAMPLE_ID=MMETSP0101 /ASSEMBLY_ACC=CAM_ASM_000211 /LENGTH=689 /DNA_ID=CAMNT_0001477795 /DNA_START=37 /DNA_END=2106 /DNA_ORIENTATION=-
MAEITEDVNPQVSETPSEEKIIEKTASEETEESVSKKRKADEKEVEEEESNSSETKKANLKWGDVDGSDSEAPSDTPVKASNPNQGDMTTLPTTTEEEEPTEPTTSTTPVAVPTTDEAVAIAIANATATTTTTPPSEQASVPTTDEAVAIAIAKAATTTGPSEQAKAEVVGTVSTTLCLTTNLMPQVIGANGEILMAIKAASSAEVTCKLEGAPSPAEFLILINGTFNQVHSAFGLVITYAKPTTSLVYNAKLIITRDDASGLIGKKGSVIHAIRQSLGGGDNFFKINTTQGPTPTVDLNGSLEIIMQSHYLVHHHLQNQYSRVAQRGGDPYAAMSGGDGQSSGGGDGAGAAGQGDNLKLQVDSLKLGNILGRNGARIKAIRAESGARVFIESKDIEPHRTLRWVTVTGTTEQKEFANYLIILAVNEGSIPGVDAAGAQVAATAWASLENTTAQVAAGVILPALLNQSNGGGGMGGAKSKSTGRYKNAICRNFTNGNCRFGASCDFAHGEHELQQGGGGGGGGNIYGGGGSMQQSQPYGGAGVMNPMMDPNTLVIQVAAHQLGALFGKGGDRIRDMRNHSGAKFMVEDKNQDPGRTMRNVMITGNEAQKQWGNYLVMLAVQTGENDEGGQFRQGLAQAAAACQQNLQYGGQQQYGQQQQQQYGQYGQQQQQYGQQQQQYGGGGGGGYGY